MELFSYTAVMDEDGNFIEPSTADVNSQYPRENFNNIWFSFISVYILIQGEDWNSIMNMLVRVYRIDGQKMEWIPKLYCVFGIVFGNLTLLALFVGIMLQGFESLA